MEGKPARTATVTIVSIAVCLLFPVQLFGSAYLVGTVAMNPWQSPNEWIRSYGSYAWESPETSHLGISQDLAQCDNGDVVIVGYSGNVLDSDYMAMRVDYQGNLLWHRTYYNASHSGGSCYSVVPFGAGQFLMVGTAPSYSHGDDAWLLCIDSSGRPLWNQAYGGLLDDGAFDGVACPDGGALIVGYTDERNQTSPGGGTQLIGDLWAFRIDAAGTLQWNTTYPGPGDDWGWAAACCEDGGFLLVGSTRLYPTDYLLAVRLESTGTIRWNQTYGVQGNARGYCAVTANTGGFLLAGTVEGGPGGSEALALRIDDAGNPVWNATYSWGYVATDALHCDSGFLLVGPSKDSGAFALRLDDDGFPLWLWRYSIGFGYYGLSAVADAGSGFFLVSKSDFSEVPTIVIRLPDPPMPIEWLAGIASIGYAVSSGLLLGVASYLLARPPRRGVKRPWVFSRDAPRWSLVTNVFLCSALLGAGIYALLLLPNVPVYIRQDLGAGNLWKPLLVVRMMLVSPVGLLCVGWGILASAALQIVASHHALRRALALGIVKEESMITFGVIFVVAFALVVSAYSALAGQYFVGSWFMHLYLVQFLSFAPFLVGAALAGLFPQYLYMRWWETKHRQKLVAEDGVLRAKPFG